MKPNIELHKICVWAFCLCFRGERLRNAAPNRSQREGQGAAKHKVEPKFRRFFFWFFFPLAVKNKHVRNREKKKKCDDVSSLSAADGAKRGVFFGALSHVSGETWRHPLVVPWLTPTGSGVWRPPVTLERSAAQNPSLGLRVSHGGRKSRGKERKPLVASRRVNVRVWQERT